SDSFSIELWAKLKNGNTCAGYQVFIGRYHDSSSMYWFIGCSETGAVPFFEYQSPDGTVGGGATSTTAINDGLWHHIVVTRDAISGDVNLYVDDQAPVTDSANTLNMSFAETTDLNIGWFAKAPLFHFDGAIDEVALYNKALTAGEVANLYNSGTARVYCSPAKIGVLPDSPIDFGSINVGSSSAAQTITIGNIGNMNLFLGTISTDNPEFSMNNDTCSGQSIAPAGTCTLQATFTPSTFGERSATINIPSNDPDTPTFSITLKGIGEASKIGVLPVSPVDFGSVNVGSSSAVHTFIVGNTGNIGLVIGTIKTTTVDFVISNDTCSSQTIAPTGACTLDVTFTPQTYGPSTATVSIPSNDPDTPLFSMSLTGLGQASNIGVIPTTPVDFGIVNVGSSSAPTTFTVSNSGDIALVIKTISSSNPEFGISKDTCSGQSIAPAGNCTLDVVFAPSGNGTRTSTLGIPSNDPDSGYVTVALYGTGVQYQLSVAGAVANGAGSVTDATSINCSIAADGTTTGTCSEMINPGTPVILTATPQTGAKVVWTGCDSSSGNTCNITVNATSTVTVWFNLNQYTLTVNQTGNGSGTVGGGGSFDYGTIHQVTAGADTGSIFTGWSGDCSGSTSPFPVTMLDRDMTCTATFAQSVARIMSPVTYFFKIQDAYKAVVSEDVIQAVAGDVDETLNFDRAGVSVILKGGYDLAYSGYSGVTSVNGLTVFLGTVTVSNLVIL
ncbi:MAG TPA: choice-of-anchor D domain-containing protein, partial [Thermodesulfovibrionales bacterium]|nr:choice-of-anchor D domain-containing protein [Thermodesulfovibrionales bacterium]